MISQTTTAFNCMEKEGFIFIKNKMLNWEGVFPNLHTMTDIESNRLKYSNQDTESISALQCTYLSEK